MPCLEWICCKWLRISQIAWYVCVCSWLSTSLNISEHLWTGTCTWCSSPSISGDSLHLWFLLRCYTIIFICSCRFQTFCCLTVALLRLRITLRPSAWKDHVDQRWSKMVQCTAYVALRLRKTCNKETRKQGTHTHTGWLDGKSTRGTIKHADFMSSLQILLLQTLSAAHHMEPDSSGADMHWHVCINCIKPLLVSKLKSWISTFASACKHPRCSLMCFLQF